MWSKGKEGGASELKGRKGGEAQEHFAEVEQLLELEGAEREERVGETGARKGKEEERKRDA